MERRAVKPYVRSLILRPFDQLSHSLTVAAQRPRNFWQQKVWKCRKIQDQKHQECELGHGKVWTHHQFKRDSGDITSVSFSLSLSLSLSFSPSLSLSLSRFQRAHLTHNVQIASALLITIWGLVFSICPSAFILQNHFRLWQFVEKVKFDKARRLFWYFASPRWSPLRRRTKVVSFSYFPRPCKQKIKMLRPKMSKITSSGPPSRTVLIIFLKLGTHVQFFINSMATIFVLPKLSYDLSTLENSYYPGQKNWNSHACQTTGASMLERAPACTPVHAVVLIFWPGQYFLPYLIQRSSRLLSKILTTG